MEARDNETIRRIIEDQEAIQALGVAEARRQDEAGSLAIAWAALTLLPYAGTQGVFDALFKLAFLQSGRQSGH